MKYSFRGNIVFEYIPDKKTVIEHTIKSDYPIPGEDLRISAFNYCNYIPEDFKLLSEFFDKVYRHIQGEEVLLQDIDVY